MTLAMHATIVRAIRLLLEVTIVGPVCRPVGWTSSPSEKRRTGSPSYVTRRSEALVL